MSTGLIIATAVYFLLIATTIAVFYVVMTKAKRAQVAFKKELKRKQEAIAVEICRIKENQD